MYDTEVIFLIPGRGSFTYTTGCNVSNVFGINCLSTSAFVAPTGTGTVAYDSTTDSATVHFPVPKFNSSYSGTGNGGGGGKGGPRPKAVIAITDRQYVGVEFAVATAGMCLAVAAFEATPIGWAATGVGLVAYGLTANDFWHVK